LNKCHSNFDCLFTNVNNFSLSFPKISLVVTVEANSKDSYGQHANCTRINNAKTKKIFSWGVAPWLFPCLWPLSNNTGHTRCSVGVSLQAYETAAIITALHVDSVAGVETTFTRRFYLSVNRASPLPRNFDMSPDAIAAAPLLPLILPLLTRATDWFTDCVASSHCKQKLLCQRQLDSS